jgi:hypothetical protein
MTTAGECMDSYALIVTQRASVTDLVKAGRRALPLAPCIVTVIAAIGKVHLISNILFLLLESLLIDLLLSLPVLVLLSYSLYFILLLSWLLSLRRFSG